MANENIVDFDAMKRGAVAIDLTNEQLKKIDQGMMSAIEVLERNWTGAASYQFNSVMQDWRVSYNDIIAQLQNIHLHLVGTTDMSLKNEHANTPMIDSVRSQLHFNTPQYVNKPQV
jgi:WXG100 family type VII secretion target